MTRYHSSYQPPLTFPASAASAAPQAAFAAFDSLALSPEAASLAAFSASLAIPLAAFDVSLAASSATLASYVATSVAGSVAHPNVAAIQNQVLSEIEFALLS